MIGENSLHYINAVNFRFLFHDEIDVLDISQCKSLNIRIFQRLFRHISKGNKNHFEQ